jgi:ubiquinone/menaquinone biosynthesis C-methylase UbiE
MPEMTSLGRRLYLARQICEVHYFQPATVLWRLFELEVLLEHLEGRGIGLDVGCGDGTLAILYLSPAPEVRWIGLEIDLTDAVLSHRRGLYSSVWGASAEKIPAASASVDLVLANSSLEHMPALDRVLEEIARVLKPGGRFFCTVPAFSFHRNLLLSGLLERIGLRSAAARYRTWVDRRLHHFHYLTFEDWQERLRSHGIEATREQPYLSRRALRAWEMLANATGGLAYLLAGGRSSPREIQQAVGVQGRRRPVVGRLVWILLLPVLLWTASQKRVRHPSALYLEGSRRS